MKFNLKRKVLKILVRKTYKLILYNPKILIFILITYKLFQIIRQKLLTILVICLEIINLIQKYTDEGVNDYTNSVQGWLDSTNYSIDSEEKLNLFKKMFNMSVDL